MSTPTEQPESNPIPLDEPAAASPEAGATASTPKAKVSPARNAVSLVLLIVLLIVGGLELTALFQFNGAVSKLDQALEANQDDLLPLTDVEALLGKQPDGPLQPADRGTQQTSYTWQGAIRAHKLTAFYSYGEKPGMVRYEIGDAEAADPGE
jgi:hypothetical protein